MYPRALVRYKSRLAAYESLARASGASQLPANRKQCMETLPRAIFFASGGGLFRE